MPELPPPLGASFSQEATTFHVWAPRPERVELFLEMAAGNRSVPIDADRNGYRTLVVPGIAVGTRYGYLLDGQGPFPDPCSRHQPDGPHALSAVIDPNDFAWSDREWTSTPFCDAVIYECHIGTFTEGGTFDSAIGRLASLRDLGVTAVELMPVASFPGRWNWGYDGVSLFAPAQVYGGPDGLRRFVDAAHRLGLAVVLDVVYNHFGPDGNYTGLFSSDYTTSRYRTPWGDAVNFDGSSSIHTRRFFRENLLHWLLEYHLDGFRFDATHAIFDSSELHILAELSEAVALAAPRDRPYLIAESHENDIRYLQPRSVGGFGFDAVWADDFHHAIRTAILHENEGYFRAFDGSLAELARTVRNGFLFEGQIDPATGAARGTKARTQPWRSFVYCIQNHDQVGNRAFGQRLNSVCGQQDFLAASLLLLLLPQVPMLFQGQEFLAHQPFLYFSDHSDHLGDAIREGRLREFAAFRAFSDPAVREMIPDPQASTSFERSKLDHDDAEWGLGLLARWLYREALAIRQSDPVLAHYRSARLPIGTSWRGGCLALEFTTPGGRRLLVVNFGDAAAISLKAASSYRVTFQSNEGRFGGNGLAAVLSNGTLSVPGHASVFLSEGE